MKTFLIGAICGAIIAIIASVIIQGPATFLDKTPSMVFGTIRGGSLFVTMLAALAAAIVCGFIAVFISMPITKEWKWTIAGIAAAALVLALFLTSVNFR